MLGQSDDDLNFILERINGVIIVQSFCLLIVLLVYLYWEIRLGKMSWRDIFMARIPIGMSLALALLTEEIGILTLRGAIYAWRRFGGGETASPMNRSERISLLVGTLICAVGILWLTRILSRPMFGDWPWLVAAGLSAVYLSQAFVLHYL